ncbi:HAD family hydrolase [Quadrisphaera sp. INWT6]|uniref:HAD family hydrolase n=1 Tax=Quadrisphaera sp. INWT6 TaxID=2596917 RepID=UPI00189228BD|nr:HAD family hydrolase [Quadrisphaera sp. INWT6]MBF5083651.1 HAD family hydrolase [Quadrisphaera sp. INWT6]
MLRAVLFDLDDTLVDQRTAAAAAVRAWGAEHGVDDDGAVERWTALCDLHYERYQRRELTFLEQRRVRVRAFLDRPSADDDEADALFAGYLHRYESGWTRYGDAVPALRRVRAAGLVTAVLTNGDAEQQRGKIERTGLGGEVDVVVASSELSAGKPDPCAYAEALARVGVAAHEAVMVGDSLVNDVRGALAAGLGAVLLDRRGEHPGADVPRISTLDELDPRLLSGPDGVVDAP